MLAGRDHDRDHHRHHHHDEKSVQANAEGAGMWVTAGTSFASCHSLAGSPRPHMRGVE